MQEALSSLFIEDAESPLPAHPKTLAVMDQAFAAIWNVLKADAPFSDYAKDGELRIAVGQKLLNLVADGVTDPGRLRQLTVESLLPGHWRAEIIGRPHN
jgi:hypothetical protein